MKTNQIETTETESEQYNRRRAEVDLAIARGATPEIGEYSAAEVKQAGSFASDPAAKGDDKSAILDTERTAPVVIRGETKTVWYDLSELTPRLRKLLAKSDGADDSDDAAALYVATVVTDWNVTDRQGQPVPLTTEGVQGLSYKAINAIMEALNGGPNASGAGDQTGARPS